MGGKHRLAGHDCICQVHHLPMGPPGLITEHVEGWFSLTRTEFLLDDHEAASVLARFTGGGTRRTDRTAASDANADV